LSCLTAVVALDAKLNVEKDSAGKDLETIEKKIVLRLRRMLTEHSADDIDSSGVNLVLVFTIHLVHNYTYIFNFTAMNQSS